MMLQDSERWVVHNGDCREVLAQLPADSVDACVTDPPYGLEFMGKEFDRLGDGPAQQAWHLAWALELLRVLKPGAHLLAFGGTRTYHRMVCAIEDAGFEIRDSLHWFYGSGFPKSLNVSKALDDAAGVEREKIGEGVGRTGEAAQPQGSSFSDDSYQWPGKFDITAPATDAAKQWDGWGTALKPAHEPVVLARKPLIGTVAANVIRYGTGALNIDASRIHSGPSAGGGVSGSSALGQSSGWNAHENRTTAIDRSMASGRWPANILLDEDAAAELDEQTGVLKSGANPTRRKGHKFGPSCYGQFGGKTEVPARGADEGMGSRLFKVIKCDESVSAVELALMVGRRHEDASALSRAKANHKQDTSTPQASTIETQNWSEQKEDPATPTTRSSGDEPLLGPQHEEPTQKTSRALDAGQNEATGITPTTPGQPTSRECVAAATSGSTSQKSEHGEKDLGGSRFRYVAKPKRGERDAWLRQQAGNNGPPNFHPTVKPIELMRYLVRLVTPKNGIVLDPFIGSGSTGVAALLEGFRCIGIEQSAEYAELARARMGPAAPGQSSDDYMAGQLALFGGRA